MERIKRWFNSFFIIAMADTTRRVREAYGDTRNYKRDPEMRNIQRMNFEGNTDFAELDATFFQMLRKKIWGIFSSDKTK